MSLKSRDRNSAVSHHSEDGEETQYTGSIHLSESAYRLTLLFFFTLSRVYEET